jgi:Uma2 family endonuclease
LSKSSSPLKGTKSLANFFFWNTIEGTLQIITISLEHERLKKLIARLLEAYAEEKNIDLNSYGATTFRKQAKARGLEPDECYTIGEIKDMPDIAIEIVITSGGIDKLEAYRGLEVPEVWFWQDNQFSLYHLQNNTYKTVTRSHKLPELDLDHFSSYVSWTNQTQAVKAYRATIKRLGK